MDVIKRGFLLHRFVVLHISKYYYCHLTLFCEEFFLRTHCIKSAVTIRRVPIFRGSVSYGSMHSNQDPLHTRYRIQLKCYLRYTEDQKDQL